MILLNAPYLIVDLTPFVYCDIATKFGNLNSKLAEIGYVRLPVIVVEACSCHIHVARYHLTTLPTKYVPTTDRIILVSKDFSNIAVSHSTQVTDSPNTDAYTRI